MYTMYGYQVNPESDSFVTTAEEAIEMLIYSMSPGAHVVNNLPFRESIQYFKLKTSCLLRNATQSGTSLLGFREQDSSDSLISVNGLPRICKTSLLIWSKRTW